MKHYFLLYLTCLPCQNMSNGFVYLNTIVCCESLATRFCPSLAKREGPVYGCVSSPFRLWYNGQHTLMITMASGYWQWVHAFRMGGSGKNEHVPDQAKQILLRTRLISKSNILSYQFKPVHHLRWRLKVYFNTKGANILSFLKKLRKLASRPGTF